MDSRPTSTPENPPLPDTASRWQRLPGGIRIATPDTLDQITAYVLEEQGDWFEDEVRFVRTLVRGGQTAVDGGANHGVYALSMAQLVGPGGHVHAVEPARSVAARLQASADANGFTQLHVLVGALSDHEGTAVLNTGASSELSTLGQPRGGGSGETVALLTLDACAARQGWKDVAFIKLDVEGEEIRTLAGGRGLVERDEPLLMLEYRNGGRVNDGLLEWLVASGHGLYRLAPGLGLLVPHPPGAPADEFLLNVFAARPSRASKLERAGLLARSLAAEIELPALVPWQEVLQGVAVTARQGAAPFPGGGGPHARHRAAIERYGLSQRRDVPAGVRAMALKSAVDLAASSLSAPGDLGRLMTTARLAAAWGARRAALDVVQTALFLVGKGQGRFTEPFLPARPRFDAVDPGERLGPWAVSCLMEQREVLRAHSSFFTRHEPGTRASLELLQQLGFSGPEMERRLALVR